MNAKILALTLLSITIISFAQGQTRQINAGQQKPTSDSAIYQLFSTQNNWTFIKLDTRNGKMWQIHFSVNDDGGQGELVLNSLPLVTIDKEVNGRFTLYSTENIYNFLLLDQINGNVYQVQWSMDPKYRGVIRIE